MGPGFSVGWRNPHLPWGALGSLQAQRSILDALWFRRTYDAAAKKHLRPVVLEPMTRLRALLAGISDWNKAALQQAVEQAASEFDLKLGKIAQPLRVAVTGGGVSPSIEDTLSLLGRQRCLQRLDRALDYIKQRADALTEGRG